MNDIQTPITLIKEFHLEHDALNKELEKFVVEQMERKDQKKEQHSNIGGWQSERENSTQNWGKGHLMPMLYLNYLPASLPQ